MLKPCGYRVIVTPDTLEEVTESGIVIAYENKDREQANIWYGTLVAIGPTAWKQDGGNWAEVGDRVNFAKYTGRFIDDPDDPDGKYIILNDEDILCIIKKAKEQ
jgi:co-chaperonin GroES (HSP10)